MCEQSFGSVEWRGVNVSEIKSWEVGQAGTGIRARTGNM